MNKPSLGCPTWIFYPPTWGTGSMSKSSKKQEQKRKQHWSIKNQESLISRNKDGHFCLNVEGGAEVGLFPFIGDLRQDRIHYSRGKLHPGDLILSVNNKRVPGMIKKDVIALIKRSADPVSLVTVRQSKLVGVKVGEGWKGGEWGGEEGGRGRGRGGKNMN